MKITYVTNSEGTQIDYEVAVQHMDDELREELHMDLAPCTEQEFFTAYAAAHLAQFGETWFLDEENPTY